MNIESSSSRSILKQRDFVLFLAARATSSTAIRMQAVAVGWQVYETTHSALDLGLVSLALFLPFVVLVLPAGHVADHFDRRRIAVLCIALQLLCAVGLVVLSIKGLANVWPVLILMTLFGATRAFYIPVMQALVPNLVERADLHRAVALNATVSQVATVIGPALGGVLYLLGPVTVYMIVATFFAVAIAVLWWMHDTPREAREPEAVNWKTVLSGLHFVWSKPAIFGAMSLDLFAVLFGGATALLPIYASDILHVGPSGLGLMRAAPGVGASLCAFWLSVSPISRHVGRWMLWSVGVFGAATIVFGVVHHFVVALLALAIVGASDMVSVYVRNLLIQMETPDAIRGRVNAVSAVMIGASNELGEFESGLLASWCGAVRAVVIGGVLTVAITGAWARFFPALRKMDRFAHTP